MAGLMTEEHGEGWPARGRDSAWGLFAQGGPGDRARPNAWQVVVLNDLSGADGRCSGASDDEVFGVLGQWGVAGSWLEGRKLAVVRELIRRRPDERGAGAATGSGLPWDWDKRLAREVSLQLGLSVPAAGKLVWVAWALEARLPGVGRALDEGRVDARGAWTVVQETDVLQDPGLLAAAEEVILGGLAGCRTWAELLRLVQRAVVGVDPDGARRRREQEERENARVRFWREAAGTCALMGAGLPTDEALMAHAHVEQRARAYRAAGVKRPIDILRVAAYLDMLNLVPAADRIARFRAEDQAGAGEDCGQADRDAWMRAAARRAAARAGRNQPGTGGGDPDDVGRDGPGDGSPGGAGPGGSGSGPGDGDRDRPRDGDFAGGAPGGDGARGDGDGYPSDWPPDVPPCPGCGYDDCRCGGPRDGDTRDGSAGERGTDDCGNGAGDRSPGGYPWDCPPDDLFPPGDYVPDEPACAGCGWTGCRCGHPHDGDPGDGGSRDSGKHAGGGGGDSGDGGSGGNGSGDGGSGSVPQAGLGIASEVNLTLRHLDIPFLTAAGRAQRAGEARSLGVLDPALARTLAEAAARHPDSRFCVTIVDGDGHAIGHGCARPRRTGRAGRRRKARQPGKGQRDGPPPLPPSPAASAFTFTARDGPGPPGGFGSWLLSLPGRAGELIVDLHSVPTGECGHQYQSPRHDPGDLLRHLVTIRDGKCGFPTCSRHASESDFEHARPFDQGGATCGCNCWACSRSCHQLKQSNGWTVTEAKPGYHQWTTPSGRAYTQEPWTYPT